jgi:hypothetical protein
MVRQRGGAEVALGQQRRKSDGLTGPEGPAGTAGGNGFVERLEVGPTGTGSLDGLSFAVKDLIDIGAHKTGCGNPTWRDTHPPASVNAVCVEQLLEAGARCVGKTVSDELAFSLLGENHFYGNAAQPESSRSGPRRLLKRLGFRRSLRAGRLRAGHRHQRFGPRSGK